MQTSVVLLLNAWPQRRLGACDAARGMRCGPDPSMQSFRIHDSEAACFPKFSFPLPRDTFIKRGLVLTEKHFVLFSGIDHFLKSGLATPRCSDQEAVIFRRKESGAQLG